MADPAPPAPQAARDRACPGGRGARSIWLIAVAVITLALPTAPPAAAQDDSVVVLTLESAAAMAMDDSYQVRQLRLEVERTRTLLQAERAGLRSRVYMDFSAPQFERISQSEWNSTLQRNEIVRQHSQLWQMDFSVEQPVILFGYPTNGYLSLNNRIYRYTQFEEDGRDVNYYSRYFIQYEQPLFQPNELRNDLEEAELDLESAELDFQDDALDMLGEIAEDYHDLVELAYEEVIYTDLVANLEAISATAQERVATDSTRGIDDTQARVGLANAREQLQKSRIDFRLAASGMKQTLRLDESDSLVVSPHLDIVPIQVDPEVAVQYGLTLRPQLRALDIQLRNNQIELSNTRGDNSFRMNLELTYGREMEDPVLRHLLRTPANSYTIGISGYIPIWDWGSRKARIQADRLSMDRTRLSIEETREQIETEIRNIVRNLTEYQERALGMQQNLNLAKEVSAASVAQYREGRATVLDALQAFDRQVDTANNFLQAYLGYREAALDLQQMTYYDFEHGVPVLERYSIDAADEP